MPGHLFQHYRDTVAARGFEPDPAQDRAAEALDRIYRQLATAERPDRNLFSRFARRQPDPVQGLYLWGGVGRGKTFLMDLFFDTLPQQNKTRLHFHRFMQRVHDALRMRAKQRDPLPQIAKAWAERARVLCFDEFFVTDIADAMLLGGLLDGLFQNGVTLIATSNIPPDELYRDGLQRAKFLPAIDLIKAHTQVLELTGNVDFRLRILKKAEIYHWPLDQRADDQLQRYFREIAPGECLDDPKLVINGRNFHSRCRGDGVIWFDFAELCAKPRGAADYIELARAFNTVLLSNVPQLDEPQSDQARRFITLVDEFYDRQVKLIITAADDLENLYRGQRLQFEFRRTVSRLQEMQSLDYLALPHRP